MAEDLDERQVGLGHGDVAPQRLGELVGGARPFGDQAVELVGAAAVQREALVDQGAVVGDRVAVARAAPGRGPSRACCASDSM